MEIITKSHFQTKKLGEILAKEITRFKSPRAVVLGLVGDLGGGKTTFLQGFAKGLGIKEKILSPSFILMRKFNIKHRTSNFKHFYHFDCYRISKGKEILSLGFKRIIKNPKNIVAIEWADKAKKILPKNSIKINFKLVNKNTRKITLKING